MVSYCLTVKLQLFVFCSNVTHKWFLLVCLFVFCFNIASVMSVSLTPFRSKFTIFYHNSWLWVWVALTAVYNVRIFRDSCRRCSWARMTSSAGLMHLSMSSPRAGKGSTHGNLTVTYIPRVGIFIGHLFPRVGNFGIVAVLDNTVCYIFSSRKEGNHLLMFCIKV